MTIVHILKKEEAEERTRTSKIIKSYDVLLIKYNGFSGKQPS